MKAIMRYLHTRRDTLRANDQSGFTMIVTLVVLMTTGLLMAAAFAAANGDIHLTQTDSNAKKAYYAAQAGISDYIFHLNKDVNYWTYCTGGGASENHALNQAGSTTNRVPVPGASEEEYAIGLLPASTNTEATPKCNSASPVSSMIEGGTKFGGTFRIESTGFSGNQTRTIVATFGHSSFLNFIYYTEYETSDPVTYSPVEPRCAAPYHTRPEPPCSTIEFVTADHVNGPFHSEDTVAICGEPTFGRKPSDEIEFKGGWRSMCSGSSPKFVGTDITTNLKSIKPPPNDITLKTVVESAYHYSGKTTITLEGEKMQVNTGGSTHENVPFPPNGLIYVSSESCPTYTPFGTKYSEESSSCGNVFVKGSYTKPLTIASENDVVIDGNLTTTVNSEGVPTTNAVLGLIADNFVRVYHPLTGHRSTGNCETSQNATPELKNLSIYAAILAVNHSFIVDNYDCGNPLGTLSVYGAIAQIFRGPVGTHSGETVTSGYAKNYNYDDRLKVDSPPDFLSPVEAAWLVERENLAPNP
jgi:type II secretory pathway pseudopilin PulG